MGIISDTYRQFFIHSTPFNLLLMFVLLVWTQDKPNRFFVCFVAVATIAGLMLEWIGVNTGMLFGRYSYGTVLGYRWQGVPLLIGVNWFIIMYCCGIAVHTILNKIAQRLSATGQVPSPPLRLLSVAIDGATLAVFFDWVMEPLAVKLGFWQWEGDGTIPFYNYACWFLAGAFLLTFFHFLPFSKNNKFAIHLLLIQLMFFLLLRTFYY